jgi:hypothetical protein
VFFAGDPRPLFRGFSATVVFYLSGGFMNKRLIAFVVSAAFFLPTAALADTKNPVVGGYFQVEHAVINADLNAVKAAASDLAQKGSGGQ